MYMYYAIIMLLLSSGDYHDEMSSAHFEEWWVNRLLPNIPPHSLIVMDNAPYHSRRKEEYPVKSWTKKKLIEWLNQKSITYPEKALKSEIWAIVEVNRPSTPEYVVDELASQAGHEVVRLPVAHCELNPIEKAWAQVKHHIKTHNTKFTLSEMERLTHEAFQVVTPERWSSLIAHVQEKVEDHYWDSDGLQMELVEQFIIRVEENDDESSDESDSDSE